jgi:hypothetical protein
MGTLVATVNAEALTAKEVARRKNDSLAPVTRLDGLNSPTPGTKEALTVTQAQCACVAKTPPLTAKEVARRKKASRAPVTRMGSLKSPTPGIKEQSTITKGDCTMTWGGRAKVEHYFDKNMCMLNKNIPDEFEYFKETVDLTFDVNYGRQKYGFTAVEFFADLRHKGVWGKGLSYSDSDSSPGSPSNVSFSDPSSQAVFGSHSHLSNKALLWLNEAWLMFSPSAPLGGGKNHLHIVKMGWHPYSLGRGIALGGFYGLNGDRLGLFQSFNEDKAAPGILLNGVIVKDLLSYDLYYAKFEERNKGLGDTFNQLKANIVGHRARPWRGEAKDNDLFAVRLNINPLKPGHAAGKLDLDPYIFYNAASDQKVALPPDAKLNWGSYGMAIEHACGNFEWGAEAAFNYGKQQVFNIDRNINKIVNTKVGTSVGGDIYAIQEVYTHIRQGSVAGIPVPVWGTPGPSGTGTRQAATQPIVDNGTSKNGQEIVLTNGTHTGWWNTGSNGNPLDPTNRFRPAYTNHLTGWMGVVDTAYTVAAWHLKIALAYGYASGDNNPNLVPQNKNYGGFVGLHELYNGKRVKSVLLDERLLLRPTGLVAGQTPKVSADFSMSDLQYVGAGLSWTPKCFLNDLSINPNVLMFWNAHESYKFIPNSTIIPEGGVVSANERARSFLGTEYNLWANCKIITDLKMYVNMAFFVPGGFFKDVKGVPLSRDFLASLVDSTDDASERLRPGMYRLGDDTAFHLNIGFDFRF